MKIPFSYSRCSRPVWSIARSWYSLLLLISRELWRRYWLAAALLPYLKVLYWRRPDWHSYQYPAEIVRTVCGFGRPRFVVDLIQKHSIDLPPYRKTVSVTWYVSMWSGSFVDYSIPYTTDCRMIHNAVKLALQQERQRDAGKPSLDSSSVWSTQVVAGWTDCLTVRMRVPE